MSELKTSNERANPVAEKLRDHAKYGRFGNYNDVGLEGACEIERLHDLNGYLQRELGRVCQETREALSREVAALRSTHETLPASNEKLLMQARDLLRQSLCSECGGRGWESGTRGCDWCKERAGVIERLAGASDETLVLLPGEDIAEALERQGDALSLRAARHIRIKWNTEEGLRQQLRRATTQLNATGEHELKANEQPDEDPSGYPIALREP